MTTVVVAPERLERWVQNFGVRHGGADLSVGQGVLVGEAVDGSTFRAELPFSWQYEGPAEVAAFQAECAPPEDWAVLLVRKGGFAIARLCGPTTVASKVGQRHVQGRTKAGGQSQQRFARRRDNQARAAFEAAAEHAVRLIADAGCVVLGGDATAAGAVLEDPRLAPLARRVVGSFLTVPDPRRSVLEEACLDARAAQVRVDNA